MIENPTIPLSQNTCAIVDPEDFVLLDGHKWSLGKKRQLRYARRYVGRKTIYMHREIMNAPAGVQMTTLTVTASIIER